MSAFFPSSTMASRAAARELARRAAAAAGTHDSALSDSSPEVSLAASSSSSFVSSSHAPDDPSSYRRWEATSSPTSEVTHAAAPDGRPRTLSERLDKDMDVDVMADVVSDYLRELAIGTRSGGGLDDDLAPENDDLTRPYVKSLIIGYLGPDSFTFTTNGDLADPASFNTVPIRRCYVPVARDRYPHLPAVMLRTIKPICIGQPIKLLHIPEYEPLQIQCTCGKLQCRYEVYCNCPADAWCPWPLDFHSGFHCPPHIDTRPPIALPSDPK